MGRVVLTVGNFDGVHVGHRRILARARAAADARGAEVVVLTFEPHPIWVLRPDAAPPRLTDAAARARLLLAAGADRVVTAVADAALLHLPAERFLDRVLAEHDPLAFVEGRDFRFGAQRRGDLALLAQRGAAAGFEVLAVDPVEVVLSDLLVARASSSLARWLLAQGRVLDAAVVLGRPFTLTAPVVQGDQRGRTLGFPTINLDPAALATAMLPAEGVYAGAACLAPLSPGESVASSPTPGEGAPPHPALDRHGESAEALTPSPSPEVRGEQEEAPRLRRAFPAAISVGMKPTFRGRDLVIEAHLLGFTGEAYGQVATLHFTRWLRGQSAFPGADALRQQLQRDTAAVAALARAGLLEGPPRLVPMEAATSSAPAAR